MDFLSFFPPFCLLEVLQLMHTWRMSDVNSPLELIPQHPCGDQVWSLTGALTLLWSLSLLDLLSFSWSLFSCIIQLLLSFSCQTTTTTVGYFGRCGNSVVGCGNSLYDDGTVFIHSFILRSRGFLSGDLPQTLTVQWLPFGRLMNRDICQFSETALCPFPVLSRPTTIDHTSSFLWAMCHVYRCFLWTANK